MTWYVQPYHVMVAVLPEIELGGHKCFRYSSIVINDKEWNHKVMKFQNELYEFHFLFLFCRDCAILLIPVLKIVLEVFPHQTVPRWEMSKTEFFMSLCSLIWILYELVSINSYLSIESSYFNDWTLGFVYPGPGVACQDSNKVT